MVGDFYKETKVSEVFWPFEKKRGLEKNILQGKIDGKRETCRKTDRAVGMGHTEYF